MALTWGGFSSSFLQKDHGARRCSSRGRPSQLTSLSLSQTSRLLSSFSSSFPSSSSTAGHVCLSLISLQLLESCAARTAPTAAPPVLAHSSALLYIRIQVCGSSYEMDMCLLAKGYLGVTDPPRGVKSKAFQCARPLQTLSRRKAMEGAGPGHTWGHCPQEGNWDVWKGVLGEGRTV